VPTAVRLRSWASALRVPLVRLRVPLLWLGRLAIMAAVTAGAVAGGRLLERHVRSAPAFATTSIELEGNQRLERERVLAVAGLAIGKNVFEVSPEQARAALLEQPWIADADVTRRLPGSYRISVREQQPAALIALESLHLVSEEATVFKKLEAGDPSDLPVITGIEPAAFRADLALRSSILVSAVALLHDYRDAGLWAREPIAEIHVEPDESFTLYLGKDALQARLGARPFTKKLRRLRAVLDELKRGGAGQRPAYVYLDNEKRPDRVAVRLKNHE
jgi:cell division protein FtsQ